MKSLKKTLVLLVVLSMLLSAISPVFAANFNDEISADYWEYANKLAAIGVITGDEKGNLNAEENITRAEMAVIICKMTGVTEATANASKNIPSVFEDVPAGEWYTGWINLAVDNGIIAGFPDNTFRPNDPLTLNQAITLVIKALGKGEYVNKMGTYPGNFVKEGAKLGITANLVNTNSELANRGNVTILVWEGMQVGTWDVISTTLDGEVTLSEHQSLLIKYFKDFVAGNGKATDPYRVKLIEDAVVTKTGLTSSDLGANQIVIAAAADGTTRFDGERAVYWDIDNVAEYVDAQKKPSKTYKTSTYEADGELVAYLPEEVGSIDNLINKKVDVLFGADNKIALLYITEDTVDEAYVTAWDAGNKKITIDGTTYKVNTDAQVSIFNYDMEMNDDAIDMITTLVETTLDVEKPNKTFNRALKADIVLDASDKIEKINFTFSADGLTENVEDGELTIKEGVVKSVSTSGIVKKLGGGSFFSSNSIDDLMDAEETRVIKDGAVSELDAIEEGDVITAISIDDVVSLVYVSSGKSEGEVSKVKDYALTVDSEVYKTVLLPLVNLDGEFDEAEAVADRGEVDEFIGEEIEVYLNFMGEAVAVIGKTNTTGTTIGVVTNNASLKTDDNDVEYMSVRILAADGSKGTYKIYNRKSGKDITEAADSDSNIDLADENELVKGTVVIFSADANRKIKSDEIEFPVDGEEYSFASNTGVIAVEATTAAKTIVGDGYTDDVTTIDAIGDESKNTIEYDGTTYKYSSSTIALNSDPDNVEVISGWSALIDSNDSFAAMTNPLIFAKGTKVIYFIAEVPEYRTSSEKYAVLTDVSYVENSDGDKVYEATLYFEGEEVVYELDVDAGTRRAVSEGDFVVFTVTDDTIDAITQMVARDDIADAEDYEDIFDFVSDEAISYAVNMIKSQIEVDSVEDGWVYYVEKPTDEDGDEVDQLDELELCDDGYVIYDLRTDTPTMISDIDDIVGEYVVGFESEAGEGVDILVVLK